jgi:hypothetical protein
MLAGRLVRTSTRKYVGLIAFQAMDPLEPDIDAPCQSAALAFVILRSAWVPPAATCGYGRHATCVPPTSWLKSRVAERISSRWRRL